MKNKTSSSLSVLNRIIEIDNQSKIKDFLSEDGDLLWPLIRFDLYEQITSPPIKVVSNGILGDNIRKMARIYFSKILRNPFFSSTKSDILFLTPLRTPRSVIKDNKLFNLSFC